MKHCWFDENHTDGYRVQWKINEIIHREKTAYQELVVADLAEWGRTLILDGAVQVTEKDEFIYHEMLAHVALFAHPNPKDVLIIGGGDGGILREALKHERVQSVKLVEIDEKVIEACKKYLPSIAASFQDTRLVLTIADGINYVKETEKRYDVVLVDSSDPVGPAIGLYSHEFYLNLHNILKKDGLIAVQSESPLFYNDIFKSIYTNLNSIFSMVKVYLAPIPTYVSGPWSFMIGSKKHDPAIINSGQELIDDLKYYSEDIHKGAFYLPQFIAKMLG